MALKSGDGRTDRVWSATRTRSNMKTRSSHPCLHQPTLQGYAVLCCSVVHYAATFTVASRTTTRISQHDAVCAPPSMHVTVDRKRAAHRTRRDQRRAALKSAMERMGCEHRTAPVDDATAQHTARNMHRSEAAADQPREAAEQSLVGVCGVIRRKHLECSAGKCASNRPKRTHAHGRVCRSIACSSGCCYCSPTGSKHNGCI